MKVIDPGHIYELIELGSDKTQTLTFIKRSGGAITYDHEWPGLQTQEVIRALIDRTEYLDAVLTCTETQDALYHLRMALYCYELRAYRRKRESVNRKAPSHDDSERPRPWRDNPDDMPFNEQDIENRPIGPDGHIVIT